MAVRRSISTEDENDEIVHGNKSESSRPYKERVVEPDAYWVTKKNSGYSTSEEEKGRVHSTTSKYNGDEKWRRGPDSITREKRSPLPDNKRWDRESDSDDPKGYWLLEKDRQEGDKGYSRDSRDYRDSRDDRRDSGWDRDWRDSRDYREFREWKEAKEYRDWKDSREQREFRDWRDQRESRDYRGSSRNSRDQDPLNYRGADAYGERDRRNADFRAEAERGWSREDESRGYNRSNSRAEGTEAGIFQGNENGSGARRYDSGDLDVRKWDKSIKPDPTRESKLKRSWSEDEKDSKGSGMQASSSNRPPIVHDQSHEHHGDEEGNYDSHHVSRSTKLSLERGGEHSGSHSHSQSTHQSTEKHGKDKKSPSNTPSGAGL